MTDSQTHSPDRLALMVLLVLQAVMLAAMLERVPPHPPFDVGPFAMGPFLGAALAAALAAWLAGGVHSGAGRWLSLAAVVLALISYGPHKWFDAAIPQIWPAVIAAQIACSVLIWKLVVAWTAARR